MMTDEELDQLTHIQLHLEGDGCWPDLLGQEDRVISLHSFQIARLCQGTVGGRTSVAFRFDLPDGKVVICQATLRNLCTVIDAIRALNEM